MDSIMVSVKEDKDAWDQIFGLMRRLRGEKEMSDVKLCPYDCDSCAEGRNCDGCPHDHNMKECMQTCFPQEEK